MLQFLQVAGEPLGKTGSAPEQASRSTAVLKFGSSVLQGPEDLPRVAGEIYRQSLTHDRLIVIVSAFQGETDRLFSRFDNIAGETNCGGCPDLISLGE